MRQTRLSIGCRDWQSMTEQIGATAAAVYLYLRTLMRGMQAAEITITLSELAQAVKLPSDAAESALRAICAEYMDRVDNIDGTITLLDKKEAAAQADMFRKRAARLLAKQSGQSEETCGQSGVLSVNSDNLSVKQYTTDFFMIYHGPSEEKEKAPRTPEKEKSLTEYTGRAHASAPVREAELPADQLESDYIDVCGSWPPSLRNAIRAEKDDVREAFYLAVRKRQSDDGRIWTADQVRMAWLAARRIPEERRAESILAWGMAGWKTIRDCGSGCYFEKSSGRIVSLVRGTVEYKQKNETEKSNAELAVRLARNMRRD